MKQFLTIEERENRGKKTKLFHIYSIHSDDYLGKIVWETGWRQYVFEPDSSIWSVGCLRQLADFIEKINSQKDEVRS